MQAERASISATEAQEASWVAASQRGDAYAFNRLVLRWEKTVYNLSLRMLRNPDEAAEATQEAFLSAFKNIRRFRSESKFSTWLCKIALNHCVTRAKRRPAGATLSLDDENGALPLEQLRVPETQSAALIRAEKRSRLLAALSHLPADQRAAVELKFFQELTFEQIAAMLEVPLSTVKSRLYAGLEMLKSRLGGCA